MTNVAIMGLGIVGGGVAEILTKNAEHIAKRTGDDIHIKYILDIKDFTGHPLADRVVRDIDVILSDPTVSVVAELMGGSHPAYEFSMACLKAGKSVVTSNKEVVANYGHELLRAARENHVRYLFEASVGGGIPVIRPICQCLAANEIYEIDGILNGTTNYILTQMFHNGKSFETALKEAQEKGYAERNPAADVEGMDACRKIAILSALAFGKIVDTADIMTEGITHITQSDVTDATKYGGTIKLIGSTFRVGEKVAIFVAPCIVPHVSPLASVEDVFNGILVKGDSVGDVMFYGRGAGNLPTASAVVADIIDVMSHTDMHVASWEKCDSSFTIAADTIPGIFYVRLHSQDENLPGKLQAAFEKITVVTQKSDSISFVTEKISLCALKAKLADIAPTDTIIRVLEDI